MTDLVIHALSVGGGILALSAMPGAGGRYRADIDHVRDWEPGLVISLTTQEEMLNVGAVDLGADLRARGCRWVHLPVVDFGVPGKQDEPQWEAASKAVLATLNGGGRVLVHCRGGCGRSGMAVLRLMIEAGEMPELALERLRAVRACAVETDAQMKWATEDRAREMFRSSRG